MVFEKEMCKKMLTAVDGRFAGHLVDLLAQPLQNIWQGVPFIIEDVGLFIFSLRTTRYPILSILVTDHNV
jgi:hypothetical protein